MDSEFNNNTITLSRNNISTLADKIELSDITMIYREKNTRGFMQVLFCLLCALFLFSDGGSVHESRISSFFFFASGFFMLFIAIVILFKSRGKKVIVLTSKKPTSRDNPFSSTFKTVKEANEFVRAVENTITPQVDQYNPVSVKR